MTKVSRSLVPRSYPLARRHTQAGHETSGISTQQQGHLGACSPRKLNTGKLLLKTFLSISSAILGKQTFHTWYASTLWGSYCRLFVTYSTHSSYKWKVSVGRLRKCFLPMFFGKQGYDLLDCDHMEVDLVISQIQGLNMAAYTSLTWPQFRNGHWMDIDHNWTEIV